MSLRGSSRKSRTILTQKKDLMNDPGATAQLNDTNKAKEDQTGTVKKVTTHKKAAYLQSLNESEKAANFKIIDNMNKRINFLRNPRFKTTKAPFTLNKKPTGAVEDKNNPFTVEPREIVFVDYQINGVYEIPLKITNNSTISRRFKYKPPVAEHFSVRKIKYPSNKESMIAPGMSIVMYISFFAPSFADFNDVLTIVTEENSFEIPIVARRDPPVIKLVNPMDSKACWLGDRVDMVFRCTNTGGDGGFKFFCERDEDDNKQEEADTIKLGPFTLFPSEFYLYSGNALDIFVSFNPTEEGLAEENLILACDNHTSEFYKLQGYGSMLDLDVIEVDGRPVDTKLHPLDTIFFPNTNPQSQACRVITVKNSSPILVSYHWSMYKSKSTSKIVLQDEDTHYRVEPNQGKISGGETQQFKIFFLPNHANPYYEYCDFIVEDLPINCMRNPPEALKAFAESTKTESKIAMPTYVGSNTQYLSIPFLQFNLRGQGNFREMYIDPPILEYKEPLFINKTYTKMIIMKKSKNLDEKSVTTDANSSGYKKSIRVEGKSDETFEVEVDAQRFNESTSSDEDIDISVTIRSSTCGVKTAYILVDIEDGIPLSYFIQAEFTGPHVTIVEPNVEFGLQKVNSHASFTMSVTNHSAIDAPILIKNANDFMSHSFSAFYEEYSKAVKTDKEGGQKPQRKRQKSARTITTKEGNRVFFQPQYLVIPPNSRGEITVTLSCTKEEIISEILEVMVKDGESQFINLNANIQKIKV